MNMKKFKKKLKNYYPFDKKKSCWKNPVVLTLVIVGAAAVLAVLIVGLVKWSKRDEDILDEDWMLDDEDDDVLFFSSDDDGDFNLDEN